MTKKIRFSYCLLQYQHNPWLKERLNIGVLLSAEDVRFCKLMVRGWEGRITSAYSGLSKSAFTEDVKQIERAVTAFSRTHLDRDCLLNRTHSIFSSENSNNLAFSIANCAAPGLDSSYQWLVGGVGVCADPEKRLTSIFERFVQSFDKEKSPSNRTDDQVWAEVNKLLVDRKLERHIHHDPVVTTDLGQVKFQAGYQNGSFHLIQSLSFDLVDADNIGAKAAKWGGYAQSVVDKNKNKFCPQLVIGQPSRQHLYKPYQSAKRHLQNILGHDSVIDEGNASEFVNRIEKDLLAH